MLPQVPSVRLQRFMSPGYSGRIKGLTLKPFAADPVVCFPCRLHTPCQSPSTPSVCHSEGQVHWRLIFPQGLFSFVFLLPLLVVFIPCISFPWFILGTGISSPCLIVVSVVCPQQICKGAKEYQQTYYICSSRIHITYYSVCHFFLLRLSGNSCCLHVGCIHCSEVSLQVHFLYGFFCFWCIFYYVILVIVDSSRPDC